MVESLSYALAYSVVGLVLLIAGYFVLDLLTPGRLSHRIWNDRSMSAAIVLAAAFLGLGGIVFTAIWTNATSGFGDALAYTLAFGVLGIALQVAAFLVIDALTPGKLGDTITEAALHPAAVVVAAAELAVSFIVIASIA